MAVSGAGGGGGGHRTVEEGEGLQPHCDKGSEGVLGGMTEVHLDPKSQYVYPFLGKVPKSRPHILVS